MTDFLRRQLNFKEKMNAWFHPNSVLVLTMGKVGTLTICNSLEVIGMHHAHPHSIRFTRSGVHFIKIDHKLQEKLFYAYKTILKRLKVFIWKSLPRKKVIITGLRDPFSRAISAYFEQSHYFGGIKSEWSFDDIVRDFEERFLINATTAWFDSEILPLSQIDVYKESFPKQHGYAIYENAKFKIFLYRLDFLNDVELPLRDFLKRDDFKLQSVNLTETSPHAETYLQFKKLYKFDVGVVNKILESKYMQHFYTDTERENLRERWAR